MARAASSAAVPESAVDAVTRTLTSMNAFEAELVEFLSLAEPEVLAELSPLQRAEVFLTLAKSVATLYSVTLRCNGIQSEEHPVKSEIERLRLFDEKFDRYGDWNKAPLRPSTKINSQAATRFIEHSLPDLTPEQRKSMRAISKGEDNKKRKHNSSEKQSARMAAAEFLEKAARELLGSKADGLKGPLRDGTSDEDDDERMS